MTEHTPPSKERWRGAKIEVRQAWRRDISIIHPRVKKAIDAVSEKIEHCQRTGKGDGAFVQGETGSGKTWLVDYLVDKYSQLEVELPDRTLHPVISFKVPELCNPKQFCVAVLRALNDPWAEKGTQKTLKRRVTTLLRESQVKLILLDDLQDIPLRRSTRGIESVACVIRDMIDACNAVFVMLGNRDAAVVLNHYSQIKKRAPFRVQLKYFNLIEKSRIPEFKALMHQLDEWLPLAEPSCITTSQIAGRIFCATHGVLQFILDLLDWAWPIAAKGGRESLEMEDLAIAFGKLYGDIAESVNPFSPDFSIRLLTQPGEPFHGWP